jgi:hypothetical protein
MDILFSELNLCCNEINKNKCRACWCGGNVLDASSNFGRVPGNVIRFIIIFLNLSRRSWDNTPNRASFMIVSTYSTL